MGFYLQKKEKKTIPICQKRYHKDKKNLIKVEKPSNTNSSYLIQYQRVHLILLLNPRF